LRDKSVQFRAVVDLANEFIYLRTPEGRYEYVSPYCFQFTGHSQVKFYAEDNLMDGLIHPDDRPRWRTHIHDN